MSEFQSLLPVNSTPVEQALERALARPDDLPIAIAALGRPSECPDALLPWLAWTLSVDMFDREWTSEVRRRAVEASVAMHRVKGTRASVETALQIIGATFDLQEWFEFGGDPHTFRVDVFMADLIGAGVTLHTARVNLTRSLIDITKPAREHYDVRLGESFRFKPAVKSGVRRYVLQRRSLVPQPRPHVPLSTYALGTGLRRHARHREALSPEPRTHATPTAIGAVVGVRQRLRHQETLQLIPRKGANYGR